MNSHSYPGRTRSNESPFAREVYRAEDPPEQRSALLDEIAALRAEVRTEVRALRGAIGRPRPNPEVSIELAALRASVEQLLAEPRKGDAYASLVRSLGIEGAAAGALSRAGKAKAGKSNEERLAEAVTALVEVTPWPVAFEGRSLVALVGPAGVGKTTTAAKLGARAIRRNKTVAFVSCDSYRVGALDQLRRYAELMDSEFHAVTSPEELFTVIMGITADVIIVDTSGRAVEEGSVDSMLGDERLRRVGQLKRHVEVLLCTPAALRGPDAARIARDFAATDPTSLCVTKLDETDQPSALVHAPFATKLPIATLCFGQRVPEDVGQATHAEILRRLCPAAAAAVSESTATEVQPR
jgi:flagellar biosynthesis protein FlhF